MAGCAAPLLLLGSVALSPSTLRPPQGSQTVVQSQQPPLLQTEQQTSAALRAYLPSRRALVLSTVLATTSLPTLPARALFESPEQLALIGLATAKPKLSSLVNEVAEVKRKRIKMAPDFEDDAYVFRFARSVLDPAIKEMTLAAPVIKQARAQELSAEFKASISDLDAACRLRSADDEVQALMVADKALQEFLELANAQKFDVKARDDINAYNGASGILYNKFLFAK